MEPSTAMVVAGSGCVVAGGLTAAATGPLTLDHGSWLAAYLVLVCGVSSCAIGTVQARPAEPPMPTGLAWVQLGSWWLGNAAVITGAVTDTPWVVDAAVAPLMLALAVALTDTVRSGRPASSGRLARWAYRGLLVALVVSAPIGAVLAHR